MASGRERRLTRRAGAAQSNGLAEFVAQEEMGRYRGYWWAPDSKSLVYQQTDTTGVERHTIANPAHPERPPLVQAYPRPGRKNASVRLGVISARGGKTRWIRWDHKRHPYLVRVTWPSRAPLTVVVQDREQSELAVLSANPATGATSLLLTERDASWVNIDPQMPRWLGDGSGFLWTTERRGALQLELRSRDGKLQHPLTSPSLGYRRLLDVAHKRGELFVQASSTPPEAHVYRLSLSGMGQARKVTRERGQHTAIFSRDHKTHVRTLAPLRGQRRTTVHRLDGSVLGTIKQTSEAPPFMPNLELVKIGKRGLHAALVRPRNFDARHRYPVIVHVYGGPHVLTVRATWERYLISQWMANHGFVVISVDGRGTPYHWALQEAPAGKIAPRSRTLSCPRTPQITP